MPTTETDQNYAFAQYPPIPSGGTYPAPHPYPPAPPTPTPAPAELGPLQALLGEWKGTGFNTIWRPHFPAAPQDRFLELNLTQETLTFSLINGPIPNRGLLQDDINMFGLTYMQQISDATDGAGLHIEPGIWASVPQTTNPAEPPTVVRMASIPHGTTIVAQGTALTVSGPPTIQANNIIPFPIGGPIPPNSQFASAAATFTELTLATPSVFRSPANPGITQAMVENPNSVLTAALTGATIKDTTVLVIATDAQPVPGGGTANTAFLHGANGNPNANATVVSAIFWIETLQHPSGPDTLQLQYTQTVMLDFNGLRWPHVTVATLTKQ